MRVEELADPEEELGAARKRERAPGGERRLRGLDGGVDLLGARRSRPRPSGAGRRVEDGAGAARRALARRRPPIQWLIAFAACGASISSVIASSFVVSREVIAPLVSRRERERRRSRCSSWREEPGLWLPARAEAERRPRRELRARRPTAARPGCSASGSRAAEPARSSRRVEELLALAGLERGDLVARRAHDARRRSPASSLALGLEPDDPPEMTSLTIDAAPAGRADGRGAPRRDRRRGARRDASSTGSASASPRTERALRRGEAAAAWPLAPGRRRVQSHLPRLRRTASRSASARAVFTPLRRLAPRRGDASLARAATASTPRSSTPAGPRPSSAGHPRHRGERAARCRRRSSSASASSRSAAFGFVRHASDERCRYRRGDLGSRQPPEPAVERPGRMSIRSGRMATVETNPQLGQQIVEDAKRYVLYSWSVQDAIARSPSPAPRAATSGTTTASATSTSPRSSSTSRSATATRRSSRRSRNRRRRSRRSARRWRPSRARGSGSCSPRSRPGDLSISFFTNGGTEANENAIKLARWYTGRQKIVARYRSYHGATARLDDAHRRPAPLARRARDPGRRADARPVHLPLPGRPSRSLPGLHRRAAPRGDPHVRGPARRSPR